MITRNPLQTQLERLAISYKRFRLWTGLATAWSVTAFVGAVFLVIYWSTGWMTRWVFGAVVFLALLLAGVTLARTLRIRLTGRDVARAFEEENPTLNASLLAAIEQQPGADGKFSYLQERVIREAGDMVRRKGSFQKFYDRLFFAHVGHSIALVVAMAVLVGLHQSRPEALARKGVAVPAALKSIQVSPGDAEVEKGSSVAVVVQFPKPGPREAKLSFGPAGGAMRTIDLQRSLDDPLFGGTIHDVQHDFVYKVQFTGGEVGDYKIKVFELPELKQANATLNFPTYTKQEPKTIMDTTRVTAVEGTKVEYQLQLNKPVKSAELVARDNSKIALQPSPGQSNIYQLGLELLESKKYELRLVDADGRTNKAPPEFAFTAQPNRPPQFKLAFPRGDLRVSPLEEIAFAAETWDDFGLSDYGIAYSVGGDEPQFIKADVIQAPPTVAAVESTNSKALPKKQVNYMLPLETLDAQPDQLVSYFYWAEDVGPDGQPRRTYSDMFFAEVRPFEEIFRESTAGQQDQQEQQQQQGQQGNPTEQLAEIQKQIVTATWNLQRRESSLKVSPKYKDDVNVILNSQRDALQKAEAMMEELQDARLKPFLESATKSMTEAMNQLAAAGKGVTQPLPKALASEQSAYQSLLKLAAREFQVARSRQQRGGGGGGGGRNQQQVNELDLEQSEDRYETRSQAQGAQTPEQRENVQILSRLKDLARRQQDIQERLQELQTALQAADEKQREELMRQLKRLREEQRQMVQDMDEVRERVANQQNMERASEALSQLDQTREQANKAAEQMEQGQVGQALSSSARAQRDLEKLKEDFRQETSSAFTEQMRELRNQARQLAQNQEQLAQQLEKMKEPQRKSLGDSGEKAQIAERLEKQGTALTNMLSNMRQVTEQAEASEPLLSKQLYDTLRKQAQETTERDLDMSAELVRRGLLSQADQFEQRARTSLESLRDSVDRAAESVLGNEAESLRLAQRELTDLSQRLQNEIGEAGRREGGQGGQRNQLAENASGQREPGSTNLTGRAQGGGTNQLAQARGQGESESAEASEQNVEGERPRQLASNTQRQGQGRQPGRRGETGQTPGQGEQQGPGGEQQSNQQGQQQGQGQEGGRQPGQQQGQGRGEQQGQQNGRQQGGQGQGGQEEGGQNGGAGQTPQLANNNQQGGQQPGGQRQNRGGNRNGGNRNGGGAFFDNMNNGTGAREGQEGPLTGGDFRQWEDRLREVEELVSQPELREQLVRAREQARSVRAEFRRHSQEPKWDLVQNQVLTPLLEVRQRLAEELAKLESPESLVPIDRDPVPPKYSELVKNYYEKLGKD